MIRTAPIRFTPDIERWEQLLLALGCTFVADQPGWKVARAGLGVFCLHAADEPRSEAWFQSDDHRAAAEATGGRIEAKVADGKEQDFWMATMPDGVTLGFDAWQYGEGNVEGADVRLAVLPLWMTPDVEAATAAMLAIGAERRLSSDSGDWVDFTLTDGLMAVHGGEAEVVLSFEWDGDVDRLSEVLKSRGFVSRVIDEAYGRSLRIDDPDGGVELWVNERQSDLYGYREG